LEWVDHSLLQTLLTFGQSFVLTDSHLGSCCCLVVGDVFLLTC
jgi:hypothetical protein